MLDKVRVPGARCRVPGAGCKCWVPGAGCWVHLALGTEHVAPSTQHRHVARGTKNQTPSTSGVMTSKNVRVVNQLGMHARAAAKFVHLATRFQSHVQVAREARQMDGKSIMGILLLAA